MLWLNLFSPLSLLFLFVVFGFGFVALVVVWSITTLIMTMRLYTELIAYAIFFYACSACLINLWVYLPFNYNACDYFHLSPQIRFIQISFIESFFTSCFILSVWLWLLLLFFQFFANALHELTKCNSIKLLSREYVYISFSGEWNPAISMLQTHARACSIEQSVWIIILELSKSKWLNVRLKSNKTDIYRQPTIKLFPIYSMAFDSTAHNSMRVFYHQHANHQTAFAFGSFFKLFFRTGFHQLFHILNN